jgi:hypothetical protein
VSRPMYAFDPTTWRAMFHESRPRGGEVQAVWFRYRAGKPVATVGTYNPMVECRDAQPEAATYQAWVEAADDNRYGGGWFARSDGVRTWFADPSTVTPADEARARELLAAALAAFPEPPPGFDGWWTFPKQQERTGQ